MAPLGVIPVGRKAARLRKTNAALNVRNQVRAASVSLIPSVSLILCDVERQAKVKVG